MPPRRSARLAELANPHYQLPFPPNVAALLFSLLPVAARLRGREVCRGWRFFLNDARFWTRISLGDGSGNLFDPDERYFVTRSSALALLRAASQRAAGTLQALDMAGLVLDERQRDDTPLWLQPPRQFVLHWLQQSATDADKASLRDLVAQPAYSLSAEEVDTLCRELPLCRVRCPVDCGAVEALPMLRREAPFTLFTCARLSVFHHLGGGVADDAATLNLAAAVAGHSGLETLEFSEVPLTTLAVLDALVDAAVSAGVKGVRLSRCSLAPAALQALARLIQSPGFARLHVYNPDPAAAFEGPALHAFCLALSRCTSLRTLRLDGARLPWSDPSTSAASQLLIAALEGLPALQELLLRDHVPGGSPAAQRAAGECLARLIVRTTSLRRLDASLQLGAPGMAPVFLALPYCGSLVELILHEQEPVSPELARDVLLPAVGANTSLRRLQIVHPVRPRVQLDASLVAVEDILRSRRPTTGARVLEHIPH